MATDGTLLDHSGHPHGSTCLQLIHTSTKRPLNRSTPLGAPHDLHLTVPPLGYFTPNGQASHTTYSSVLESATEARTIVSYIHKFPLACLTDVKLGLYSFNPFSTAVIANDMPYFVVKNVMSVGHPWVVATDTRFKGCSRGCHRSLHPSSNRTASQPNHPSSLSSVSYQG